MLTKQDLQSIRQIMREEIDERVPRIVREINTEELIPSLLEALPHLIRAEIAPFRKEIGAILSNHEHRIRALEN